MTLGREMYDHHSIRRTVWSVFVGVLVCICVLSIAVLAVFAEVQIAETQNMLDHIRSELQTAHIRISSLEAELRCCQQEQKNTNEPTGINNERPSN